MTHFLALLEALMLRHGSLLCISLIIPSHWSVWLVVGLFFTDDKIRFEQRRIVKIINLPVIQ